MRPGIFSKGRGVHGIIVYVGGGFEDFFYSNLTIYGNIINLNFPEGV